jgi:chloramphenicol-sensitive protein RarD
VTNQAPNTHTSSANGIWLAIFTYVIWGLFPFYFVILKNVSAIEILFHRILWSAVFTLLILAIQRNLRTVKIILSSFSELKPYIYSAIFLAMNWGLYIYGIVIGDVLQLSLAYFINPLFNMLFGVLIFKEKLSFTGKLAVGLAIVGVVYRAFGVGGIPVLAVVIAIAFSLYGVFRKKTSADSISALFIESVLILPAILIAFVFFSERRTIGIMLDSGYWFIMFLLAGPITSIPLITFSMAVKRIPYYLVGFIQYIAPTILFLSAVFAFKQEWNFADLVTFMFVWVGIVLVLLEQLAKLNRKPKPEGESG